jgi:hypothetical protein
MKLDTGYTALQQAVETLLLSALRQSLYWHAVTMPPGSCGTPGIWWAWRPDSAFRSPPAIPADSFCADHRRWASSNSMIRTRSMQPTWSPIATSWADSHRELHVLPNRKLATMVVAVSGNSASNVLIDRVVMENVNGLGTRVGVWAGDFPREQQQVEISAGAVQQHHDPAISTPVLIGRLIEEITRLRRWRLRVSHLETIAPFVPTPVELSLLPRCRGLLAGASTPSRATNGRCSAARYHSGRTASTGQAY